MEIRLLKEGDYKNILTKWWLAWRFTPPPKENLPDNGVGGFMVFKDGVDICAGFLYQTNSKTAWCEFIVSNNEYRDKEGRREALELLINAFSHTAKKQGYTNIYTSLTHPSLKKAYKNCGYVTGSEKCTEMIKKL